MFSFISLYIMFKTLKQGVYFKKNQNKYKHLIKPSNLNLISVGKLNIVNNLNYGNYADITEGFVGDCSTRRRIKSCSTG